MSEFGELLRRYRDQSRELNTGKPLTQNLVADLLQAKTGLTYTSAAVSEWERGKSRIDKDDRLTLIGLISVLHEGGGIKTLQAANRLLGEGNYRELDADEMKRINPTWSDTLSTTGELSSLFSLPRTYDRFVGRDDELASLLKFLGEQRHEPLIGLFGFGGMGKSALAREAVEQALELKLFDHAVLTSAKEEYLVGENTVRRQTADYSLENLLHEILQQCGRYDALSKPVDQRQIAVQRLLGEKRVVIVLDNLETAQEGFQLIEALYQILGQSKLLVTSRHEFDYTPLRPVRLKGFSEEEGLAFLHTLGDEKGVPAILTAPKDDLLAIHEATGGAPLAMKLVVGQIRESTLSEVLAILSRAKFEERDREFYRFIFKHSWDLLTSSARRVLVSMSVFAVKSGTTKDALEDVSGESGAELSRALHQLGSMSLVEPIGSLNQRRYTIHQLTHYFILSDIVKKWS